MIHPSSDMDLLERIQHHRDPKTPRDRWALLRDLLALRHQALSHARRLGQPLWYTRRDDLPELAPLDVHRWRCTRSHCTQQQFVEVHAIACNDGRVSWAYQCATQRVGLHESHDGTDIDRIELKWGIDRDGLPKDVGIEAMIDKLSAIAQEGTSPYGTTRLDTPMRLLGTCWQQMLMHTSPES